MWKTDQEIVSEYLEGNEKALEQIIGRYLVSVYNFVYRLIGEQYADDIVQETCIKVWKNIRKYNSTQNFKTWLFTIARNTTIDYARKKRNIPFSLIEKYTETNISLEETISDEKNRADEETLEKEKNEELQKAINTLSPLHQSILYLHYNEELTFKEIGEVLGKPLNTVKSLHYRALAELRDTMKRMHQNSR